MTFSQMPHAPEVCSCSALRQATRHLTRLYDSALAPCGLGLNQYAILARLDRHGPKNLRELADLLVMDRSTLGRLLLPLEARGIVEIKAGETDRRRRQIVLTLQGKRLISEARSLWETAEEQFQSAFGSAEALGLRTMLKRVEAITLA